MKLGSRFLRATALSAMLVLTGCAEKDKNSALDSTTVLSDDIISSLDDGISRVRIPSSVSGKANDLTHIII
jgi:hypothetical protein